MYLSVELSYYPLKESYKDPIRDLIRKLASSNLEVHSNRMSTQIFGEYGAVMTVLGDTMKWSFDTYGKAVFVAKFMEGDRRPK